MYDTRVLLSMGAEVRTTLAFGSLLPSMVQGFKFWLSSLSDKCLYFLSHLAGPGSLLMHQDIGFLPFSLSLARGFCLRPRLLTLLTPQLPHSIVPYLHYINAVVCNLCMGYGGQMTQRASVTNDITGAGGY